ncbi:hypothetical protein CJU90_6532 [Yarrowia sp. C11]|nr:hypothetical protein CJU90_6532 [Yarrowia sp. C11]KAG5371232.1 hypothetical protein CKK34_1372 [Yarrowia sp. E02]
MTKPAKIIIPTADTPLAKRKNLFFLDTFINHEGHYDWQCYTRHFAWVVPNQWDTYWEFEAFCKAVNPALSTQYPGACYDSKRYRVSDTESYYEAREALMHGDYLYTCADNWYIFEVPKFSSEYVKPDSVASLQDWKDMVIRISKLEAEVEDLRQV